MRHILISGANGNLGAKLIERLLAESFCDRMIALDHQFATDRLPNDARVIRLSADLSDREGHWRDALDEVDAVVHLAAQNPYPDASWADCVASADMTFNLCEAAAATHVRRFVFASSNHVMGGYKDTPFATRPASLQTDLSPMPGTRWVVDSKVQDSPAYAVAKLMGERVLAATADKGGMTAVSLRIGWCQPGENHPRTISASGIPQAPGDALDPDAARDLLWFRQMWLSNDDFSGFVIASLRADSADWPTPAIVVNAMSANAGMAWAIDPAESLLHFRPNDNVWAQLGIDAPAL